ncbi:MAG: hypothetical protein D6755_12585 [Anaerolineae bacterium]|nr:MAG: hypothetical protein D6755_12585 [Anaerolineae bacterium]
MAEDVVRYRICGNCGFRLMRSERVFHDGGWQEYALCPVCNRKIEVQVVYPGDSLTAHERRQAWTSWLYSLGLSPEDIHRVYHLSIVDFFALQDDIPADDAPIIK